MKKKTIAIVGGGAASLFLASFLDADQFDITIYEKSKALARKFLVAGKGGFNLTHSEDIKQMVDRYTPKDFLSEALLKFDNKFYQDWLNTIGIPTYIGSSKRVFPKEDIKPIEVLNTILDLLKNKEVSIKLNHEWKGWSKTNTLLFNEDIEIQADVVVFCLGGGSWKITGSDGKWLNLFSEKGIKLKLLKLQIVPIK